MPLPDAMVDPPRPPRPGSLRMSGGCKLRSLAFCFSNEFVAPVTVPVQDILDLVCRALDITPKNLVSG